MLTPHDYKICLRSHHPEWPAAWIASALDLQPKYSRTIGEPKITSDGRVLGIHRESYCAFDMGEREIGSFADGMARLLARLGRREQAICEIRDTGGRSELFVGMFIDVRASTSFVMPADLIADLARLGLQVSVEIY